MGQLRKHRRGRNTSPDRQNRSIPRRRSIRESKEKEKLTLLYCKESGSNWKAFRCDAFPRYRSRRLSSTKLLLQIRHSSIFVTMTLASSSWHLLANGHKIPNGCSAVCRQLVGSLLLKWSNSLTPSCELQVFMSPGFFTRSPSLPTEFPRSERPCTQC